ncbi:MAG: hypothetical protein E7618_03815 [Ruminococcaceae bacterium]|nr:hypothetical protein [Oscillospiraceae bacterium]
MIKKYLLVRVLALALCTFTLIPMLASCHNTETSDQPQETVSDTEIGEETTVPVVESEPLVLIKDGEVKYELVYPLYCDAYVSAAATELRDVFRKSTGLKLGVKNDSRTEDTVTNKIIVGNAKYSACAEIYSTMKFYDYRVMVDGTNIHIAAYSEAGFVKAIKHLKENVFNKMTTTEEGQQLTLKPENLIGTLKDSYEVTSWKILDNDISKYRIIYAEKSIKDHVLAFRDHIARKCGTVLEVALDTKADPTDCEILIGNTNRDESKNTAAPTYLHYEANIVGQKLVIKSGGEHSLKNMFSSLLYDMNYMTKGKKDVVMDASFNLVGNLYNDKLDSSKPADSNLRIMSCNILAEFESWTANAALNSYLPVSIRKEIFFSSIDYYQPTIIGLQELTTNWYNAIEEYRDFDKWELIKPKNPNRTDNECVFSTVMYRKDLYTLVDSGMTFYSKHNNARCRCYTWVILKDNATGKEFCFASTHWDGAGSEHGFLQVAEFSAFVNERKKRCPVFTTGDFNSNEMSEEFKKFIADCDIYDAKYDAVTKVNDIGSWHNFTQTNISWGSCDHITATKDTTILKYQSLYQNEIYMCSDHCWLIADVKFN